MPHNPTPEVLGDLAAQARRVGALVADLIGQAITLAVPIPDDVFTVQLTLNSWARQIEGSVP